MAHFKGLIDLGVGILFILASKLLNALGVNLRIGYTLGSLIILGSFLYLIMILGNENKQDGQGK